MKAKWEEEKQYCVSLYFGLMLVWAKGGLEEYGKKCKQFGRWKLHTFARKTHT